MFTKIINGQRYCTRHSPIMIVSWDYIKEVLIESGFKIVQKASPSEYVMKGCEDKILIYVKFNESFVSTVVFLNANDRSDQQKYDWSDENDFSHNGNLILDKVRELWRRS